MRISSTAAALAATSALLFFTACEGDDRTPLTGSVVIHLEEVVDGVPVVEYNDGSNTRYDNAAGNHYGVENIEYLVSDFAMIDTGPVPKAGITQETAHYRNAFDASTATIELQEVPAGTYEGLHFWWGLAPEKNFAPTPLETGPKGLPSEFDGMLWPAGEVGGYHTMRFEGVYDKTDTDDHTFQLHMGRLVTDGGTVTTDCHAKITLDGLELRLRAGHTLHLTLRMELNHWMNDPIIDFTASTPNGMALDGPTMPNHQAQALFRDNESDVFSLEEAGG